ncbi:MAG: M4 family metallopeptidase [Ferruginibacter sp.]
MSQKLIPVKTLFVLVLLFFSSVVFAQPSLSLLKTKVQQLEKFKLPVFTMKQLSPTKAGLFFPDKKMVRKADAVTWLGTQLNLRKGADELKIDKEDITPGNFSVEHLQQYFKGIKVEHGLINVTSDNEDLVMMQMEFYSVPDNFKTTPVLSEQQALDKAIEFAGAEKYAWTNYTGTNPDYLKPTGELVIIQTYENEGEVCLAYKFNIYALKPLYRAYVYINAWDGSIVIDDPIIKHARIQNNDNKQEKHIQSNDKPFEKTPALLPPPSATINNAPGMGDTRYYGRKAVTTDHFAGSGTKQYRLRELRNNQELITLDYLQNSEDGTYNTIPTYEEQAVDFTDNDNNWNKAEYKYQDTNYVNAALDAHYCIEWVSDYWKNVHDRNGLDNNNMSITSYVHVWSDGKPFDNAYWNGTNMHFGDGNGSSDPAATSLDDCAHELGHAVTQTTSRLLYRWESGALNEAFSDIWAACITNYVNKYESTISEDTWRLFEKSSNPWGGIKKGLRDMKNPLLFENPSTYQSVFWVPGDHKTCPRPRQKGAYRNDMCGVHTNSGVLNKWFQLITDGEAGINSRFQVYNVKGLGFPVSQKIAYLTELNLTPNADYATTMTVSLNVAASVYGYGSPEHQTLLDAWFAVGVDSAVYHMQNTPVFTTNNFTSIAVGKDGYVFAGTNYSGIYKYDGVNWEKLSELPDVKINDIKPDKAGDIWVAQSGRSGTQSGGSSIAGGVNYFKYPYTAASSFYTVGAQTQIPSRNARCIFVDTTRTNDGANPKVWVAMTSFITSSNSSSGMLGQGLYSTYKQFLPISQGINIASGTVGCLTVGGNSSEIWTFVQANNGINQLLSYDAGTNQLITTYDHNSHPDLPSGFVARAIYGDNKKRIWVGLATGGVMVFDENKKWHAVNYPELFPSGAEVLFNSIGGDQFGDVYIGTNKGIVFFDHGIGQTDRLDNPEYYKLFTKANGLMSNTINAIAYDTSRYKFWVATDSGVIAWVPQCLDKSCRDYPRYKTDETETVADGNWSNPAIWSNGLVPDSTTAVVISNKVAIDINGVCQSLSVAKTGNVTINTGKKLTIFETESVIMTSDKQLLQLKLRSRQSIKR